MEFPSEELIFLDKDLFSTASPHGDPGEFGIELLAQIRDNGRILDHSRLVLGGSAIQSAAIQMTSMFSLPSLTGWKFKFQYWPRDVTIRRNMCSSVWVDASTMIGSKEAVVCDANDAQVPYEAVLGILNEKKVEAAIRWVAVAGEDSKMKLHLHSLPTAAANLSGKPLLRG